VRVIGLTGGIASGKSTVSAMFRELGAEIVDADRIARELVGPGRAALSEIVRTFGSGLLAGDGTLDRKRLAELVFDDDAARRRLEAILHPRIVDESNRRFRELSARGTAIAIYEAALLVETGRHRDFDALIVVVAAEEERVRRLQARDGLDEAGARRRLAAQISDADRIAAATHVIRCEGPLDEIRARVREVWRRLGEDGGARPVPREPR
jgi:dephospho-CoA kinase